MSSLGCIQVYFFTNQVSAITVSEATNHVSSGKLNRTVTYLLNSADDHAHTRPSVRERTDRHLVVYDDSVSVLSLVDNN